MSGDSLYFSISTVPRFSSFTHHTKIKEGNQEGERQRWKVLAGVWGGLSAFANCHLGKLDSEVAAVIGDLILRDEEHAHKEHFPGL